MTLLSALFVGIASQSLPAPIGDVPAVAPHLFIVTSNVSAGNTAVMQLGPPWAIVDNVEPVGADAVARHFSGWHYVVNPHEATVQVIDPRTFDTRIEFSVGLGSNPRDVLVADHRTAYVTRYEHTHLFRVDPISGLGQDVVDLSVLADSDGLPEMSMMARYGDLLFVQLQKVEHATGAPPPGGDSACLAVVDLKTETLVDVDPLKPGLQGIELSGPVPDHKMQIDPVSKLLYVSVPGRRLDSAGAIEIVDLVNLKSQGFLLTETAQLGGIDLTGFLLVPPLKGYVIAHTEIVPSNHLHVFNLQNPIPRPIFQSLFHNVHNLAYDPRGQRLFFPDGSPGAFGIQVFDATTDQLLTTVPTALAPRDLVVVGLD